MERSEDSDNATVAVLVSHLQAISDKMTRLNSSVTMLQTRVRTSRAAIAMLVFGFIVDVIVTIFIGTTTNFLTQANNRITTVQQRTSSEVLCPLYTLFISSISATHGHPLPGSGQTQAQYDASVATIKSGYTTLGCLPALTR